MHAISRTDEENACMIAEVCGSNPSSRLVVQGSDTEPCASHSENSAKTSNRGGPRPGFGGPQPGSGRPRKRPIQTLPLGLRWYVAEIFGGAEQRIAQDLLEGETRLGYPKRPPFDVHAPTIAKERRIRGVHRVEHVPMFPGYVFVQFDRTVDDWGLINGMDGVRGVIRTRTHTPIPTPVGFVEWLIKDAPRRLKLAAGKMPQFEPGQRLRVMDGPFAEFPATCIACDGRVTSAHVHIFGRDTRVEMARDMFSAS